MKLGIETSTNKVIFKDIISVSDKVYGKGFTSKSFNDSTMYVVEVDSLPQPWIIEAYGYNTETNQLDIINQTLIDDYNAAKYSALIEKRSNEAKAEASRRIFSVFDQNAQMNVSAAYGANLLDTNQQAAYIAGLAWIASVRAAWQGIANNTELDIYDDINWPLPTEAMIALGDAF